MRPTSEISHNLGQLVDKKLGDLYLVIENVNESLAEIKHVSHYMENLFDIHTNLASLVSLSTQDDALNFTADNIADLTTYFSNLNTLITNRTSLDALADEIVENATLAQNYANAAENTEVETGLYSAMHFAIKAAATKAEIETLKTNTEEAVQVIADAASISATSSANSATASENSRIQTELFLNMFKNFHNVTEMVSHDFGSSVPIYLKTYEFSDNSIYGAAQYKLLDDNAIALPGDQTMLNGKKYRLYQETVHPQMFGDKSLTDNAALFQQAVDFASDTSAQINVPNDTYKFTNSILVKESNLVLGGRGNETVLQWDDPDGVLFEGGSDTPDTVSVASVAIRNMRIRAGVAPTQGATGARAFRLRRAVSWFFDNVRTENFFIHYDTFGLTRPKFDNCNAYGNTLWPVGVNVPESCFLSLDAHVLTDTSRRPAANVALSNTEMTGNYAALKNMDNCIHIKDCDGIFVDPSTYLGLANKAVVRCVPSAPDSVLTNFYFSNFFDGGQNSTDNIVEFTEPSANYMTGTRKNNHFAGILSGAGGSAFRLDIGGLEALKIDAVIKASGAYGINIVKDVEGLNIAGSVFESNALGDVNNAVASVIGGASAVTTDKSASIPIAQTIELPASKSVFSLIGANINIVTMNGGWEGREVTLLHKNAGQGTLGGGNISKIIGPTTTNNDISRWIYNDSVWNVIGFIDN